MRHLRTQSITHPNKQKHKRGTMGYPSKNAQKEGNINKHSNSSNLLGPGDRAILLRQLKATITVRPETAAPPGMTPPTILVPHPASPAAAAKTNFVWFLVSILLSVCCRDLGTGLGLRSSVFSQTRGSEKQGHSLKAKDVVKQRIHSKSHLLTPFLIVL